MQNVLDPRERPTWNARDLYNAPTLVSLTRVPLAAAFVLLRDQPVWALGALAAAGLSDVLDGWLARRLGKSSTVGAFVDGLVDKVFVLSVVLALLASGRMSPAELVLLGARDLGELLLLLWASLRSPWLFGQLRPHAVVAGKATTVLQFAAVVAAVLGRPVLPFVAGAAALGLVTVFGYARELRRLRLFLAAPPDGGNRPRPVRCSPEAPLRTRRAEPKASSRPDPRSGAARNPRSGLAPDGGEAAPVGEGHGAGVEGGVGGF